MLNHKDFMYYAEILLFPIALRKRDQLKYLIHFSHLKWWIFLHRESAEGAGCCSGSFPVNLLWGSEKAALHECCGSWNPALQQHCLCWHAQSVCEEYRTARFPCQKGTDKWHNSRDQLYLAGDIDWGEKCLSKHLLRHFCPAWHC